MLPRPLAYRNSRRGLVSAIRNALSALAAGRCCQGVDLGLIISGSPRLSDRGGLDAALGGRARAARGSGR